MKEKNRPMIEFKANMRYFHPWRKKGTVVTLVVGLLLVVAGIVLMSQLKKPLFSYLSYALLGVGGVMALASVVSLVVHAILCPSDAKIDAVYQRLADAATHDALEKSGLDETALASGRPVVLSACVYENIVTDVMMRVGRDGATRSSNFANFVLLFDTDQILVYHNCHSLVRDEWSESLSEYFYSDIVNLSTEVVFASGVRQEKIKLLTSAGTEVELPFRDNDVAKEAIMTIRKALRATKHVVAQPQDPTQPTPPIL